MGAGRHARLETPRWRTQEPGTEPRSESIQDKTSGPARTAVLFQDREQKPVQHTKFPTV